MMPENKGLSTFHKLQILSLIVIFALFSPLQTLANHGETPVDSSAASHTAAEAHPETAEAHEITHAEAGHEASHEEAFNPGKMILDHVKDAHDWHIMDINGHAVSIPLPVILYDNGLHIFSSSRFEHGHATVESKGNYYVLHEGHIYKTEADGHLNKDEKGKVSNVAPLDLSVTKNVFALFVGSVIILLVFLNVAKAYKKRGIGAPKGLQNLLEILIVFLKDDVIKPSIGKHYAKFLPLLLSIFFFIFINNLMGLIPIFPFGANLTGNIAVTMILAIFVFIVVNFSGNKHYWKHIFMPDVPVALWVLLIPIEILGVILKPFVLMLRLFANITAGHIIILGFFSLIFIFGQKSVAAGYGASVLSVAFTLFMSVLELLVAFLQAYVFTLLASLYIGTSTEEHHHAEEHH